MHRLLLLPLLALPVFFVGCGSGSDFSLPLGNANNYVVNPPNPGNQGEVTLAAGLSEVEPAPVDSLSAGANLTRFSVTNFTRTYELTTPSGADFAFSVVARMLGNTGQVRVSLGHVAMGGMTPNIGSESLAAAGMQIDAPALSYRNEFVDAIGDGFARLTLRGSITADQVLLFQVQLPTGVANLGVRISLGAASVINVGASQVNFRPGTTTSTIYSSDSFGFGLPALAVSGDRYTIAAYDSDSNNVRRRQWLQVATATGAVTGAQVDCPSADSGYWRDQEIAALGNVVAVVFTGDNQVRADVSIDRGGHFGIPLILDTGLGWSWRLVQVAISTDYRIACIFWRTVAVAGQPKGQLALVEGTPTGFDPNNTPTGYGWSTPYVIENTNVDCTPLISHLAYSSGGDLVIGYGYTRQQVRPGRVELESTFKCAVREFGQLGWRNTLVDTDVRVVPSDPHVALVGSGASMEIYYAYERSDGVYLQRSTNAGWTFTTVASVQEVGASLPSIFVRDQGGQKRVDLLFISQQGMGNEIHNLFWSNFTPGTPGTRFKLTQVQSIPGALPPMPGWPLMDATVSVPSLGYDAEIKGDDVAIAVHEFTQQAYDYTWWPGLGIPPGLPPAPGAPGAPIFFSSPPPVTLLPGITGSVATPNTSHRHQLKLIVID